MKKNISVRLFFLIFAVVYGVCTLPFEGVVRTCNDM